MHTYIYIYTFILSLYIYSTPKITHLHHPNGDYYHFSLLTFLHVNFTHFLYTVNIYIFLYKVSYCYSDPPLVNCIVRVNLAVAIFKSCGIHWVNYISYINLRASPNSQLIKEAWPCTKTRSDWLKTVVGNTKVDSSGKLTPRVRAGVPKSSRGCSFS